MVETGRMKSAIRAGTRYRTQANSAVMTLYGAAPPPAGLTPKRRRRPAQTKTQSAK